MIRLRPLSLLAGLTLTACGSDRAIAPEKIPELTVPIGVVIDVKPACANPAPLNGKFDARAPGYIVVLKDGSPVDATTDRLAGQYHFTVKFRYTVIPGFATTDATAEAVAGMRCDAAVRYIDHDASVSLE